MSRDQWSVVAKRRASFLAACALGSGVVWFTGCNPGSPSASNDSGGEKIEIARSKNLKAPEVDEEDSAVQEPNSSSKSVYGDDEPEVPSLRSSSGAGSRTDDAELVDESEEDEAVLFTRLSKLAEEAAAQQQGKVSRKSLPTLRTKHRERIAVADKILKLAKPSAEAVQTAYQVKLDAYDNLIALETPNAGEEFRALCAELVNHSDPQLARVGRIMTLQFLSQDWLQSKSNNGRQLVDAVIEVLTHTELEPQLIGVCAKIAGDLNEAKLPDDAAEVYEAIAQSAAKSEDARMKVEASAAGLQAKLLREGVHSAVDEYAAATEAPDMTDVAAKIEKVFEGATPDAGSFSVFSNLAARWEAEGLLRPSEQLYVGIQKLFANVDDKTLAPRVKATLETARKRLGLIGQSMSIEGNTLDGEAFDWSAYKGKVVLVDFWATWCEPCREEMGNISQVYEKYREAGFEVVGVNLDEDQDVLSQFKAANKLPWTNVVSDKNTELGFNNPLAVRCGVRYIPFVMLIDKTGKVAAIHTRGERLEPAVKLLLDEANGGASSQQVGVAPVENEREANEPGTLPSNDDASAVAGEGKGKSNPLRTGRKPPPAPLRKK